MAPHSSTLAWQISRMEEPGRLQSMGSQRVGHDWATSLSLLCTGEGNGNRLQCSCLENPRDWGAWWAAISRVAQSRTRLKRLSSSSSKWIIEAITQIIPAKIRKCSWSRRCFVRLCSYIFQIITLIFSLLFMKTHKLSNLCNIYFLYAAFAAITV